MDIVKHGDITELDGRVRVEPLPRLIKATATPELLDNSVTADHYQPPRPASGDEIASPAVLTNDEGERLFLDAKGKGIELGKPFQYLDWYGHADPDNDHATVWGLYRYEPLSAAELKERGWDDKALERLTPERREEVSNVWREIAQLDTYDEALTQATQLLSEGAS